MIKNYIKKIHRKKFALVYVDIKYKTEGYSFYDYWDEKVVNEWKNAIIELEGEPILYDINSFLFNASYDRLNNIDFVINLNAGIKNLSTLALVPSICAYFSIPCLPCDSNTIIAGENKYISNCIVSSLDTIRVPEYHYNKKEGFMCRPYNSGSSIGVQKNKKNGNNKILCQEFIHGFDMTIPILYNPLTKKLMTLPAISYVPNNESPGWFLGENEKKLHNQYIKKTILLSDDLKKHFLKLAETFSISTYARIDTRVKCKEKISLEMISNKKVSIDDVYFLEINPMPTIVSNINFHTSIKSLSADDSFYKLFSLYIENVENYSITGFILFCSVCKYLDI